MIEGERTYIGLYRDHVSREAATSVLLLVHVISALVGTTGFRLAYERLQGQQ